MEGWYVGTVDGDSNFNGFYFSCHRNCKSLQLRDPISTHPTLPQKDSPSQINFVVSNFRVWNFYLDFWQKGGNFVLNIYLYKFWPQSGISSVKFNPEYISEWIDGPSEAGYNAEQIYKSSNENRTKTHVSPNGLTLLNETYKTYRVFELLEINSFFSQASTTLRERIIKRFLKFFPRNFQY